MYGNGKVFASLDKVIPVANCETATWVVIPDDHLKKAEFYSMLLMAFAAGKKLDINSTSCHSGQATITKGSTDYILVK
jgi:hypothetical protein